MPRYENSKEGVCPKCGSEYDFDYADEEYSGWYFYGKVHCPACDWVGYEVYEMKFLFMEDNS